MKSRRKSHTVANRSVREDVLASSAQLSMAVVGNDGEHASPILTVVMDAHTRTILGCHVS